MGGPGCDLVQLVKGPIHTERSPGGGLCAGKRLGSTCRRPPACKEDASKETCCAVRKGRKLTREQKSRHLTGKRGALGVFPDVWTPHGLSLPLLT